MAGLLAWLWLLAGPSLPAGLSPSGPPERALAQDACAADPEPNDDPSAAVQLDDVRCVIGSLPDGDSQDLLLWTLPQADASTSWRLVLRGVPGSLTSAQILSLTDESTGAAPTVGQKLVQVDVPPGSLESISSGDLLLAPGTYVVAVFRSAFAPGFGAAGETSEQPVDYEVVLEAGTRLPPRGDAEPNDDAASAMEVADAFALSGDLAGSRDVFAWTLAGSDPGTAMAITAKGVAGSVPILTLATEEGIPLVTTTGYASAVATIPDLQLPPGRYLVTVEGTGSGPQPYVLSTVEIPAEGTDAEPNDTPDRALPLSLGSMASGRLARDGDRDSYRLRVDAAAAARQLDVKLLGSGAPRREVCVLTQAGDLTLRCAYGEGALALPDLLLAAGDYIIQVHGEVGSEVPYHLRVDSTSLPAADFELEPNDQPDMATPMSTDTVMRGRLREGDSDIFRAQVDGELGLWEIVAEGDRISALQWLRPDRRSLGEGALSSDLRSARITDMLLVPGDHWFSVTGEGEYRIRFASLGPPDPQAEREPNGDGQLAEPILVGEERLGRLPATNDQDVSRLSLAAVEHLRFEVEPAPGSAVRFGLVDRTGAWLVAPFAGGPGEALAYESVLLPGDYEIWLRPVEPSSDQYRLRVVRLDPFDVVADAEPNDDVAHAAALPATLQVEGSSRPGGDVDWYHLPPLPADGQLTLRVEGDAEPALSDGAFESPVATIADGGWQSPILLAGSTTFVGVESRGPYRLDVDPGSTGLVKVQLPAAPGGAASPDLELVLSIDDAPVAAYWPEGQRLDAVLRIENDGSQEIEVALDSATSDPLVELLLEVSAVTVAAGSSVEVPAEVLIGADARADTPVQLTARARSDAGSPVSVSADLTPTGAAAPGQVIPWWPLPSQLLGGVDVAATALGATVLPVVDAEGEARLHDGVVPADGGLDAPYASLPLTLTVDLAGDEPVPIRGTILHATSSGAMPAAVPRSFQLLLSSDGATYVPALSGELPPDGREHGYSLDEPVPARFAQLRVDSTWGFGSGLTLGEWKVVAEPGASVDLAPPGSSSLPTSTQVNVAAPELGGHVAWIAPQLSTQADADAILLDDGTSTRVQVSKGQRPTLTVGFHETRTAALERMEWLPAPGSDRAASLKTVHVAVSTVGPAGPWQDLGTWRLRPAADGRVAPFLFRESTWARYVRLTGDALRAETYVELPATIRILERPTGPQYRSILGEWGLGSPRGPAEWLQPPEPAVDGPDAPDSAEQAVPLSPGTPVDGSVHRGVDVDWFAISIPEGQRSVVVTLAGRPTVGTTVDIVDVAGAMLPTSLELGEDPGTVVYLASVTPGQTYRVRVSQPPASVYFVFDTSGSVASFLPYVYSGLRSFSEGVREGQESVKMAAFQERPMLEDWTDETFVIQDAVNRYVTVGESSSAEATLLDALDELQVRPGARTILLVTDADTSSYDQNERLWQVLERVRPTIHAVHMGTQAAAPRHFMQDWAAVASGHYQLVTGHTDVDRAFDRMATQLRRPARYVLSYDTAAEPVPGPAPGRLVVDSVGAAVEVGPSTRTGAAVGIVLDTSASMLEPLGRKRRIDVAKAALRDLIFNGLPAGTPVALRAFRQVPKSCESELIAPLAPLDADTLAPLVDALSVDKRIGTPLAAAIEAVGQDLADATGTRIAVVLSDGQESCDGDPEAAVRSLAAQGIDIRLNIVGIGLDRASRKRVARLAELGQGAYFDARDPRALARAVRQAVATPFRVIDADGTEVATGSLGGEALELPPGVYEVEVLSTPAQVFDAVLVRSGETSRIGVHIGEGG